MFCTLVRIWATPQFPGVKPSPCTSIWRFCPPSSEMDCGYMGHASGPVLTEGHLRRWSQGRGTPDSGPKRHRELSGSPGPTLLILFCSEKRTWRGNLFPPHVSIRRPRISTIPSLLRNHARIPPARLLRSPARPCEAKDYFRSVSRHLHPRPQTDYPTDASLSPPPPLASNPPPDGSRHILSGGQISTVQFTSEVIP